MKDMDKQVRELIKKETLEEDPVFSENLLRMAKELVKQSRCGQKRGSRASLCRKCIPAAVLAVLLAAYPAKAAADYVAERLSKVSEEEKNKLRTMIHENGEQDSSADKEAVRYSRDFTEDEQELYDTLQEQYQKGVFPQDTLTVLDGSAAADGSNVCYSAKDNCLYLPERGLTKEELLEIIDFYHKMDYSLRTSDTTLKYKKDMEKKKSVMPADAMPEEEALASAAFYTEKMYGISAETMESRVESDAGDYLVTFTADGVSYSVHVSADDGAFLDIAIDQEGFAYYQDNLEADEDRLRKKGKEAKAIAVQLLGEEAVITDACAQYKLNTEKQIPHGSVVYLFDLEDGGRLRMSYSVAEDVLWGAVIEKYGAGQKDMHVKDGEKRVFLEID